MRVAVFNAFATQEVAETELARRMVLAAQALGWEAREVASSVEVRSFAPDFVIALHFFTPKLTAHPTYGCLWNPPVFFEGDPGHVRNVLTYDGYLSSSPFMSRWVEERLEGSPKKYFVAPFYASCNRIPYRPPTLDHPRLLYAGTNWDGTRLRELFLRLDAEPYVDIHGPKDRWRHLGKTYRGSLPFDGKSLPEALHRAGVGLCLHREEHCAAGTPSLRIFEIAASGAIAICQEHPFIRDAFGDSVLYLDRSLDAAALAAQVGEHMRWIGSHRDEALAMSRRAHAIFESRFTLETLLEGVAKEHRKLLPAKAFVPTRSPAAPASPRVQFVVRAGERSLRTLRRALDSLAAQTSGGVGAVLLRYQDLDLTEIVDAYRGTLPLTIVDGRRDGVRSTHLWEGLRAVSTEYFGVLDDDDALHPNHVAGLLSILEANRGAGVAYSGSIRIWEPGIGADGESASLHAEPAELAYGEPFDRGKLFALHNYITSNAFLARTSLLQELPEDPQLPVLEDLFLLLALSLQAPFVYSQEATCEFYWRACGTENSVLRQRASWDSTAEKLARLIWTDGLLARHGNAAVAEQYRAALQSCGLHLVRELAQRDELIRTMERSKGWKLILAWRRAKARLRTTAARFLGGS